MKTYFKLIVVLLSAVLTFGVSHAQGDIIVTSNYDLLYSTIKSGLPASVLKTAYISEFSLVEKSQITIYQRTGDGLKVEISILKISKDDDDIYYDRNSVLGYLTAGCKTFGSKYSKFNNSKCSFYVNSPEDALEAAKNGITEKIDNRYLVEGSLVEIYKNICVPNDPGTVEKKPAVYLYPLETTDVSVKVRVNGSIIYSDPEYNTGWSVNVTPDGMINNKYDYLFYEANLKKYEVPDEGWVVEYDNLKNWCDEYLPKLGLNKKEKEQFEEYWLAKLRKAKYYDIRMLDGKFLSENMDLLIEPKPETLIRLNFYFKPLSSKIELKAPEIKEVTRKGFTVVEWGGINGGDLKIVP